MKKVQRYGILLAASLILLLSLAACGGVARTGAGTITLDQQRVTSIVENMLNGYNTGDYETFSRDLAPQMKLVISEEMFNNFLTQSEQTLGLFKSIASVEQVDTGSGSTSWRVTAEFANTTQQFTITFNNSSGKIEGMDFGQVP